MNLDALGDQPGHLRLPNKDSTIMQVLVPISFAEAAPNGPPYLPSNFKTDECFVLARRLKCLLTHDFSRPRLGFLWLNDGSNHDARLPT